MPPLKNQTRGDNRCTFDDLQEQSLPAVKEKGSPLVDDLADNSERESQGMVSAKEFTGPGR